MKRKIGSYLALPVFLILGFFFATNDVFLQYAEAASAPDEIIVKYKPAVSETTKQRLRQTHGTPLKHRIEKIRAEVVRVPDRKIEDRIQRYKKDPNIEYAEPNYQATAFAISNDVSLSQQWGLFKINAANATSQSVWDVTTGNTNIKIAILDTGIEESHSDLSGKVVGSANFTSSPTVIDQDGHGTHVAGIAAAATNNNNGIAGTGYNASLLNAKVLDDTGSGYYSWIANGIIWAADNGANVINLSLGGPSSSFALQDAVNYAWSKGVVITAAAGNNNSSSPSYPAYYQNSIAVAATDSNDSKASFSNYGSWVDVASPGVAIYSTVNGNSYATWSGTSMATPFTAGLAALVWAKGTCTTNVCVREYIEKTADPIDGTGPNWKWGRINAYKAVSTVLPTPTPTPTPTPLPLMTVSALSMSSTYLSSTQRRINSTITVVNEATSTPLSSATVKATITSPSGIATTFSGQTNSSGKVTLQLRSREKGTFITTITSVSKTSHTYHPTKTTQSLLVQ